jgi:TolB-like protein/tetratricopeptide (TPR) repeat protein/DNA-binding winged helix-turn-helix (wHTH) protein
MLNALMSRNLLFDGFSLDGWSIEPLTGQVTSPTGEETHLPPKAMDVLVCLASRHGEVVERTTLFEEVWGSLNWSDEALTHCISEIRHTLHDSVDAPKFLQTIPKRGYRLIAEVVPTAGAAHASAPLAPEGDGGFFPQQFGDLRKRKVFQTVVGYPVLAWLLVQIVDIIWEYLLAPLGAPVWIAPAFVALLALGYPVAVFFAWAVDLTPKGIRLTHTDKSGRPLTGLAAVSIFTVLVAAGALFLYFNALDEAPTQPTVTADVTPEPQSVAVLRFLNIGDNPALQYLCDGLTEELIHELVNLGGLKVPARTTVWPLSTNEMKAPEIAKLLQVDKVIEGSIRADGEQVRITAQLIDRDGFHIWSEAYDRTFDETLDVQKEIASKIVANLALTLDDQQRERLTRRPTSVSSAYDEYLRGRQFLRMPGNPTSLESAKGHFERAIGLDSRFPLAYAGLCEVMLANYRLTRETAEFSDAEIACHRALTLDGGLAEVYTALGNLYRHSGQGEKAKEEYEMALSINPMLEEATFGLGRVYQAEGRIALAEQTLLRTVKLEPHYWGTHFGVANFYYRQGDFKKAVPFYRAVTELKPGYAGAWVNLGASQMNRGDWDAAEKAYRTSLLLNESSMAFQNLGTLYYYTHDFESAVAMQRKSIELAPSDHRAWGRLAAALRYSGNAASHESREAYEAALSLVEERLAVNPDDDEDLMYLGAYLVNLGQNGEAIAAVARAAELAPDSPSPRYFEAIVHNFVGNFDKSLEKLEKAAKLGYPLRLIAADPQFKNLNNNVRFRMITSTMKQEETL